MRRPHACLLAAALLPLFAHAATPEDARYREAFEAGYQAALEAARAAVAEGRSLDTLQPTVPTTPPPDAASSAAPAATAATDTGDSAREPREWWNHSSLRYPLRTDRWRHGAQLSLTFASLDGNEKGDIYRGNGRLHSRYGRWTNELSLTVDKRDTQYPGGGGNVRDLFALQESLRYDLTPAWYTAGGFILERDDQSLISRRITALLGVGRYWIDDDRFRLNTYVALGFLDERYMSYVRNHVGVNQRDSALGYFYQTFDWQLSSNWSLRQGFRLMYDLSKSDSYEFDPINSIPPGPDNPMGFERYRAYDNTYRYRTIAALDFDYRLSPTSKVSFGIENRYDNNPWPGVKRRDDVRRMTFNLMF